MGNRIGILSPFLTFGRDSSPAIGLARYGAPHGEWPVYGGDLGSTKYSPLAEIDEANVERPTTTWVWRSPDDALVADPEGSDFRYVRGGERSASGPGGCPLAKPPYARWTAIDLDTGDHVWQIPLGDGVRQWLIALAIR